MARNPATLRAKWLGKLLRELRDETDRTLAEVADYLNRSPSIVSRMENGALPIPQQDVENLLDLYRVSDPARREALLRLHRMAGLPAWWDVYAEDVAEPVIELAWFESLATAMKIYCATIVDGLLQTAAYARAVAQAADLEGTDDVDRLVEMRLMRQAVLSRANPPQFSAVIDEAVLRRPVGGPTVMAGQLRHLVALAERPHVEIRVLPFRSGAHASPDGGFRFLELPEPLSEVVTVECTAGQLYLEPPRTTSFTIGHDRLRLAALGVDQTAELLTGMADELGHP
jgi:hypothetical protein